MLATLRVSLVDERNNLRAVRRRRERNGLKEDVAMRVMHEDIRDMIKQFKKLEGPFLSQKGKDLEKGGKWDDFYYGDYCEITFLQRFVWTREVGSVKTLMDALTKLQVRRITKQMEDLQK